MTVNPTPKLLLVGSLVVAAVGLALVFSGRSAVVPEEATIGPRPVLPDRASD
jgi:hypothetical protein